jgi:hypothetical protein
MRQYFFDAVPREAIIFVENTMVSKRAQSLNAGPRHFVTYLHILCQPVKRNVTTACDLENLVRGAHLCLLRAHAGLAPQAPSIAIHRQKTARARRLAAQGDFEASWRRMAGRGELSEMT